MSLNKVFISGNLTRDAEVRSNQGGTAITTFGMAVNDRVKDEQGNWTDRPNFVECVMFGKRGEAMHDKGYLRKGARLAVEGRLRWSQWEKDGQKRTKLEVVVDEVEAMEAKRQAEDYHAEIPF